MTALFKKNTEETDDKKSDKKKKSAKKEAAIQGQKGKVLPALVLNTPLITEKAHAFSEKGKYVFVVSPNANKSSIKQSVEKLYEVKVLSVRTHKSKPKKRRFGKSVGFTAGKKKAIVTLKEGQSIDLFKNA